MRSIVLALSHADFRHSMTTEALAKLNKTGTSAMAGVQNVLKRLDSCFRRNDGEGLLQEAPLNGIIEIGKTFTTARQRMVR